MFLKIALFCLLICSMQHFLYQFYFCIVFLLLTVIGRIVILRTIESEGTQIGHCVVACTLVYAIPLSHDIDVVKHIVDRSTRLVDSTNDSPSALS